MPGAPLADSRAPQGPPMTPFAPPLYAHTVPPSPPHPNEVPFVPPPPHGPTPEPDDQPPDVIDPPIPGENPVPVREPPYMPPPTAIN